MQHEDEHEDEHGNDHDGDHVDEDHDDHEEEEEAFGLLPGSDLDTWGASAGASFVGERGFVGFSVSKL